MKLSCLIVLLIGGGLVWAEESSISTTERIRIILPEVEDSSYEKIRPPNLEFLNFLTNSSGQYKVDLERLPPARAIATFGQMSSGCFLGGGPATLNLYVDKKLEFYKLSDSNLFGYTLVDSHLMELSSKTTLAAIRGLNQEKHLPILSEQVIAKFNDLEQAIKMLERDRVQGILYWDSIPLELTTRLKKISASPLRVDETGLNCIANKSSKGFIEYLNEHY